MRSGTSSLRGTRSRRSRAVASSPSEIAKGSAERLAASVIDVGSSATRNSTGRPHGLRRIAAQHSAR